MLQPGFPILSSDKKREWDKYTILTEPIPSLDLLERACYRIFLSLKKELNNNQTISIVCGQGNNGADGLCLARILVFNGYSVNVQRIDFANSFSNENNIQFELLLNSNISVETIHKENYLNFLPKTEIIIDAIFGSGLNKPFDSELNFIVDKINKSNARVISIDNPSGIDTWNSIGNPFVHAQKTYCLGSISPSNFDRDFEQDLEPIDIGLSSIEGDAIGYFLKHPQSSNFIQELIPKNHKHAHKGTKGHALLLGGNKGMSGAIAMSAVSCSATGAGNVTVGSIHDTLQYLCHHPHLQFLELNLNGKSVDNIHFQKFSAIGIGPGLGVSAHTTAFLSILLNTVKNIPMVLDADALNIISQQKVLLARIPKGSIITPHPKELERLFGTFDSFEQKWHFLLEYAKTHKINILAKDTYSILFSEDGEIYVNGNGNESLAKGGSGDTLTGIIVGYLAQGILPKNAAICGMYQLLEFKNKLK